MGEGILKFGMRVRSERKSTFKSTFLQDSQLSKQRSPSSIKRNFYYRKMSEFIGQKVNQELVDGTPIVITFTKEGNRHLYSDTFGRSKILQKSDLLELPNIVRRATCIKSATLSHERDDNIVGFHYFKVSLHGETVYLNVAEESRGGKVRYHIRDFLYSITDKIRGL